MRKNHKRPSLELRFEVSRGTAGVSAGSTRCWRSTCVNGVGLIALVLYLSRRRGDGKVQIPFHLKKAFVAYLKASPALFMIVIILGGILGGVFTPTEASAVAVFCGLFLATVVYRLLTFRKFLALFRNTIEISGMVLLIIPMAALLGYALTIFQVPTALAKLAGVPAPEKILFLLLVHICFFITGMFMDTVPAILILVPLLTPMVIGRGIEPITSAFWSNAMWRSGWRRRRSATCCSLPARPPISRSNARSSRSSRWSPSWS